MFFFHKMSIELWVVILDVFHDKNRIKQQMQNGGRENMSVCCVCPLV